MSGLESVLQKGVVRNEQPRLKKGGISFRKLQNTATRISIRFT